MHHNQSIRFLLLSLCLILSLSFLSACSKTGGALAGHVEKIADIAESNQEKPADAIDELHAYLQKNLPDILHSVADIIVKIDQAESKEDAQKIVKELEENLKEPIEKAQKAIMPLIGKIQGDPEAAKKFAEIQKKFAMIESALGSIK